MEILTPSHDMNEEMKKTFTASDIGKSFHTSRSGRTVILLSVNGLDKRYSCICRAIETGRTIRCTPTGMTGIIDYKIHPHRPVEEVKTLTQEEVMKAIKLARIKSVVIDTQPQLTNEQNKNLSCEHIWHFTPKQIIDKPTP